MKLNSLANTLSAVALATVASLGLSSNAQAQFIGNSSGTWGDPDPGTNPAPVFSGVGTDTFTWGNANGFGVGANQLSFAGTAFNTGIDSLFKVGDLTYFNGTTALGSTVASVPLNVLLEFTDPFGFDESFGFNFNLVSTPNTNDPDESADFVFPINSFGSSNFSFNGIDYTLQLTGFSQDGGATSVSEFRVREGERATAAVFGRITAASVPEPASMAGLGILGIYFIVRRQKTKTISADSSN